MSLSCKRRPIHGREQISEASVLDRIHTLELRRAHIGPSTALFFNSDPLKIVRGQGQYLYNESGERFLDCINNVAHVGHSNERVTEYCSRQLSYLNTNMRFLHDNVVQLAQRLTATFPEPLSVCYFVNSGSEANDLAMRLARYYTNNAEMITLENAYHGHLTSIIPLSPYKFNSERGAFEKPAKGVRITPLPDVYRGKHRSRAGGILSLTAEEEDQLCNQYVQDFADIIQEIVADGSSKPCAFIAESMQSCGGQIIYPKNYLKRCQEVIHEHGGVMIADEVQTGFGRVGSSMWAFQMDGAGYVPDIVTVGKPMGNGIPVAAVITTPSIAESFARGPEYFNTYGGNPVASAAGLAVLDCIEEEKLMDHARELGNYLQTELMKRKEKYAVIGDVRIKGLFVGIDFVKDRETREPASTFAYAVRGNIDGPHENILKLKPPMCFNRDDADLFLNTLDDILSSLTI